MALNVIPICALVLVILAIWAALSVRNKRSHLRLPPGPPALPIVGNAFNMPRSFEWLTYQAWRYQYGSDIVHFKNFGTHIVVLNSANAMKAVFEKQSNIYSDKPWSLMLNELTGWGRNIGLMVYGDEWRAHRRMFHQYFRADAVPTYRPTVTLQIRRMLGMFLDSPTSYTSCIRHMAASTIVSIVYALDIKAEDDSYINLAVDAMDVIIDIGSPSTFLVDYIPILKYLPSWMPGGSFKIRAAEWRPKVDAFFMRPFQEVKEALAKGTARQCLVSTMLSKIRDDSDYAKYEDTMMNVAGTTFLGGFETTSATLFNFVLAMLLFPEAQRAAQHELDRVLGGQRLPEVDDRESLPYVTALMKEIFRWRPIMSLVIPHKSTADGEYNGYHIPAKSIVLGNAWAVLHDEERYPDPETFKPTRFLTSDGKLNRDVPDPDDVFGYSRRVCPGRHFALDMLWLSIASILAVFNVEKSVDESGNVVEPSGEHTSGLVSMPVPFEATFKPRSQAASNLVRSSLLMESD